MRGSETELRQRASNWVSNILLEQSPQHLAPGARSWRVARFDDEQPGKKLCGREGWSEAMARALRLADHYPLPPALPDEERDEVHISHLCAVP